MKITIIKNDGDVSSRELRNCDRCANIQDAKGKFRAEQGDGGPNFWRRLAEWLMQGADE